MSDQPEQNQEKPNVTDPAAGDPAAGDPAAGDPAAGDPAAGDPAAGDPAAGDPAAGDAPPQAQDRTSPRAGAHAPELDGQLYIVGIGASAGGLEALGELVKHVPFDNMAFVVVQHLAPQHESVLTSLLARTSKVQVVTAADGMIVESNHVYVIPPNADLALLHGVLHLITPPSAHGPRLAIDHFFRSLADDRGPSAIGIVLSGTGTDGTYGLKAIKAAGGITFVQDPATAKYDGMPRSALASGSADFCLALKEIGAELTRLSKLRVPAALKRLAAGPEVQEQLAKLFVIVRAEFGNDLTFYKPATVERRIERRMMLNKLTSLADYVKLVQSSAEELRALYGDMLITVTSFFRDKDAFEALKSAALPRLLEHRDAHAALRIWVPACATGEEAYSIAISILELLEGKVPGPRVQIFATDVDEDAIQHARRGVYAQNIAADVTPERLTRFFTKKDSDYVVTRQLRDMVVFSQQNILKDAPFSRIDLVSCRNLLIYLKPAAQKKVLRILHYALNPQGILLLGASETVSDAPELFSIIDRRNKLYAKKHVTSSSALDVGFTVPGAPDAAQSALGQRPLLSLQAITDRKVLELYGPPGVLINESLEILHFRGRTGPYLDPAPGVASFNILRLARPELHMELKRAIQQALLKQTRVTVDAPLREDGKPATVRLDAIPIQDPESKTRCLLVTFQRLPPPREVPVLPPSSDELPEPLAPLAERIQELEQELALTKEYLQTTIEEKESANEELKSANEELQSSNEELQSTNEELETSKEEMQSTNEELTTVNEELQNRMEELSIANDDLHNFLASVDNAVVIVGMDLRIRRYTAAAERLLHLVPGDIGRSISFLDPFLGDGEIGARISTIISTLSPLEQEILAANHRYYLLKISPYKTLDHSIRGAVVCLIDVDIPKRLAELTGDVSSYVGRFLRAVGHPLLVVDGKLRIVWANDTFYDSFQMKADETLGSLLPNVGDRRWADAALRGLLDAALADDKPFRGFKLPPPGPGAGDAALRIGANRIPTLGDATLLLVSIELDGPSPERGTAP